METNKRSEIIAKFLSYLGVDIRKNDIICGLLPLGLFSVVFLTPPMSNQELTIGNSILILVLFVVVILLREKRRPGKKECKDYPIVELWDLAKERGIKFHKNPFHVVDKKGFLALTNSDQKIFLGKDYLNGLNNDEKIFVLGHESFHYFSKETIYDTVIIFLMLFLAYEFENFTHNILAGIAWSGPFLLVFSQLRRSCESMADFQGAEYSGIEAAKGALKNAYEKRKPIMFDHHPQLSLRIKNIERQHYQN